ncbi:MAG TPA: PAS domain S-box protein [Chthoniobacter sp.]|nr:PAS domain S-box protein [Chthoniobacter sp.]
MPRLLLFIALLVFVAAGHAAPVLELSPAEQAFLREHPVWRIAGGPSPPFQWIDAKGKFRGIGADYRAIVEARLGVRLEPLPSDSWATSLEQLRRRECDVSLLTAQTPDREVFLLFTEPLLVLPPSIITRVDNQQVKNLSDLAGRRVTVARSWPIHELLAREHPEIILLPREDVGGAISAVALGDADAYVGDLASATQAIDRLGIRNLKVAAESPYSFPFRIAVRKDWPEAVALLNKAIATITPEEHAEIRRKWIVMRREGLSWQRVLAYAIPMLIGSVLLTLLFLNRRLSREVGQRKSTEAALRENEERWNFALEGSRDAVWDWNVKTNEVFFSQRWKTMLGFAEDEVANRFDEWINRVHRDDLDRTLDAIQQHLRGEAPDYQVEHRVQARDGSYRWILARGRVVTRDDSGAPTRMVGTLSDITGRKQAERALQNSKEFAEELIQTANAMVVGLDEAGNVTIFNRAAEEITGYTAEEIKGRNYWETLVPREHFPEVRAALDSTPADISPHREIPILTKSGKERFIMWQSAVVRENSKEVGTVSFGIDITRRRRAEQELKRNEEHLEETVRRRTAELEQAERRIRDMTDRIPGAVYQFARYLDGTFAFEFCSEGMETMVGVPAAEAVRNVNSVWAVIHPDDLAGLVNRAGESAKTMTRYEQDLRIQQPDGRRWWIRAESEPQRRPDGTTLWNGSIMDITERKSLEEQLAVAKTAAEAASQAKSTFLANMSHEIRTPMNAILGFSQLMLRDAALNPQQRQNLDTINHSGEHLLALINDILEMSKIESGRVTLHASDFDLFALLDDLERMFRLRTDARRLHFSIERTAALPQYVKADEGKLRQIFINLLGNAVKFTENGGITVRVDATQAAGQALRLRAEVEDTGPGIAEAEMPRLFREFEQTESGLRAGGGTGLGLAISRKFARLMDGDITVESTKGSGTTFRFEVQAEVAEATAIRARAEPRRVLHLDEAHEGMRVLIADDTPENCRYLEQLLQPLGFKTRAVADGAQAVEAFTLWRPRLVLIDLRMPVLDGRAAIRQIRALPRGRDVAIIAITASAFEENRREVIEAGSDDFLGKPFREEDLFEKIAQHTGANFRYAEDAEKTDMSTGTGSLLLSQKDVEDGLPADLRSRLRAAAIQADFDQMLALLGEASPEAAHITAELRSRVERFDYQSLLSLLEPQSVVA